MATHPPLRPAIFPPLALLVFSYVLLQDHLNYHPRGLLWWKIAIFVAGMIAGAVRLVMIWLRR